MERIAAPIVHDDRGPAVANLQDGLLLVLADLGAESDDRLADRLAGERAEAAYGAATAEAVARFQRRYRDDLGLPDDSGVRVDEPTADGLNQVLDRLGAFTTNDPDTWLIAGRVEFEDASPAAGVRVIAYDREIGARRVPLGDPVTTDERGVFPAIRYAAADVRPGEGARGPGADVVFEVIPVGEDSPVRSARVPAYTVAAVRRTADRVERLVPDLDLGFDADRAETVRIVLAGRPRDGGRSEFERLTRDLRPLLLDESTPADFDQEKHHDVDFAARETGWDRALVDTMRLAWTLAREAGDDPVPLVETLYGLLRPGPPTEVQPLPGNLPELLAEHARWAAKLDDALTHRIIGRAHPGRLRDLRIRHDIRPGDPRAASPSDVLAQAGFGDDDRRALLAAYAEHTGDVGEFWAQVVPQRLDWPADRIAEAEDALRLADLLGRDLHLIAAVRDRAQGPVRDLVTWSPADWAGLVTEVGPAPQTPGQTRAEQVDVTVRAITGAVDAAFPTGAVAHLARTSEDPGLAGARELLDRFFTAEADREGGFDIITMPVTEFVETHRERLFADLGDDDRARVTGQLQRLQRVFRLGVDRAGTAALLDLGLDSAFTVARFSPEHFVAEFGERLGGPEAAARTYGRAEHVAATVVDLYTDLWQGLHGVTPAAVRGAFSDERITALKELPTYRALFGSAELCDCDQCQSVYSPAAYFVDLLHMLDRPGLTSAFNPVEALLDRRPDLASIQLTCANTNTLIPYVDLVTEVLESFVAHRRPLAFNEPPPPPDDLLPAPSAAELRVNPIFLTDMSAANADQAYAALQEAVFPLELPLNLPWETTRAFLGDLGTDRLELMRRFDRDPGLEPLMAQAAEVLGLAPEVFETITGATFGGAGAPRPGSTAEYFGLSAADTPTDNPRTLHNHGAPEFVRNPGNPDARRVLISSLQNALAVVTAGPLAVTGVYDTATEAAVNGYLTAKGLPATGRTDDTFWGALEGDGTHSLSVMVCPVPMLLSRTGLTYPELVDLVGTRFLNPALQGQGDQDHLARLGVPAADVRAWIQSGLGPIPAPIAAQLAVTGADPVAFTDWVGARTRAVVLNGAFDAPCDLDRTTLMHLDGTLLTPDELLTLLRFVRLWRALGWTLAEMDLVLEPGSLTMSASFSTILLLANAVQLRAALPIPVADLAGLWGPIPTSGPDSRYDQLFRNQAAELVDPVLALAPDNTELAAALGPNPPGLTDHAAPVMAALRVSAQQLAAVRAATGLADDPALPAADQPRLTLAALSAIFRMVTLARATGLAATDLIALLDLTGLNVFERPDVMPRGAALEFLDRLAAIRATGVRPGELDYLCRATPVPPSLPGAEREAWWTTLATLIDGARDLAAGGALGDDPVRERLTGLLGPDDAAAAADLVHGRALYTAPLAGLPAGFVFPAGVAGRAGYDSTRQQLRFHGAMTTADRGVMLAATGVPAAVLPAYQAAVAAIDAQPRAFVNRALSALYGPGQAVAVLIEVASLSAAGTPVPAAIDAKVADLLDRRRSVLSRALVTQTLGNATTLPDDVVAALLEQPAVLTAESGGGPAMPDYQDLDGDGLSAAYFTGTTLAGAPVVERVEGPLSFAWLGAAPAPGVPGTGFSVRWQGRLFAPASGAVTLRVRCTDGVRVRVGGDLVVDEWRDQPLTEFAATLRLDGSRFHPVVVEHYNQTGGAQFDLGWSSPSVPATRIAATAMFTEDRTRVLLRRVERVFKLGRLLAPFRLTARELAWLSARGDLTLDNLPVAGPATAATAQAMFGQWLALAGFAGLRDRYPSAGVSLLDVLDGGSPERAQELFVNLSGAEPGVLAAVVEALTVDVHDPGTATWVPSPPDLSSLDWWRRIDAALDLVTRTGTTPADLLAWARTRTVNQLPAGAETAWFSWTARDATGTDRRPDNARLAQKARDLVRARHDEDQWRAVAARLNDGLRERRTAALTGYVLAMPEMMRANVTDTGRMFEFFLIDTQTGACLTTSRIKQGISSVQLFIQRILLDLESPLVPPARVDRGRWAVTKNYRVWEANRKVLLHAESYVRETLRDDKTPLFLELESQLLQDDLTDANAEAALRRYLEQLDSVAKLTVTGSCLDGSGVLHVFARTATTPFVFYHRTCDRKGFLSWAQGVWSPWNRLPVDVSTVVDGDNSGAHLLPVVWNRRLYLFWPTLERRPQSVADLPTGFEQVDCWHVTLSWSEFKDGRWSPTRTGTPFAVSASHVDTISTVVELGRLYTPTTVRYTSTTYIPNPFGDDIVLGRDSWTEVKPTVITNNDQLNGTKLAAEGDWARHLHREQTTIVRSLLPRPVEHYLDARIEGKSLTIRVFARYRGRPSGQGRTIVTDTTAVVKEGRRTDRTIEDQKEFTSIGGEARVFRQVGSFTFPACGADLHGGSTVVELGYNSLARPQDTVNAFMALRQDFPRVSGLRLTTGLDPILRSVPNRFDVLDSDNRSGFARLSPFFYQDQRRCYLVTRDVYIRPDLEVGSRSGIFAGVKLDAGASVADRIVVRSAFTENTVNFAPGSAIATHPWAGTALTSVMAGPAAAMSDTVREAETGRWTFHQRGHGDYLFTPQWHPYTCNYLAALNQGGIPGLYTLAQQRHTDAAVGPGSPPTNFEKEYQPDPAQVASPYPVEAVDFTRTGSYSRYNWEIFYHAPMLIATQLSRAGRYEDAMRWFHVVFDPMTGEPGGGDRRFWRFEPFRTADTTRIEDSVTLLTYTGTDATKIKRRDDLRASIADWIADPFRPDVIARRRPVVYMKRVFMAYLDNLIAWADELFQRDTLESINEALQLYVLAANLLGPRPQRVPALGPVRPQTYQSLRGKLDDLSNAQVDLETRLPFTELFTPPTGAATGLTELPRTLYFCLPQNELLLNYWDTVTDRLFKIRHCRNIEGTVRDLPLFGTPIDPMLLVEAVAQGIDISSVLNDLYAPLPRQRYSASLAQALNLCEEVRSFGAALLAVLDKRDVERLAALKAVQETQLLDQVTGSKKMLISEAEQIRQGLDVAAQLASARITYYDNLLTQGLIAEEIEQLDGLEESNDWQGKASWIEATAQALNLIPNVSTGTTASVTFGGSNLGAAVSAVGRSYTSHANSLAYQANRAAITGAQARRNEEWRFQRDVAKRELSQIQRQLTSAQIRTEISRADLRSHELQRDHARAVEELQHTKFTNESRYGWLEASLRTLYLQAYRAAYEIAKRAERCWQYEQGSTATFISFGAWDSSMRGLLAGERLHRQLKQMEQARLENTAREFEITKHVSLAQLDPLALIALKQGGACEFDIPEWTFDLDYPGHFFRRLKSVSLTIPAVVGPYTGVNATLTLLRSKVRESARTVGAYDADDNYRPDHLPVEAVAVSGGQQETGRFELDFRGENYVPFEGAGAISHWRIELPTPFRSFDYDTIADVVLHVRYTSRRDDVLAPKATAALRAALTGPTDPPSLRLVSLRHEFPGEWARLISAARQGAFRVGKDRFPILVQGAAVATTEVHAALILNTPQPTAGYSATLTAAGATPVTLTWPAGPGRYRATTTPLAVPVVAAPQDSEWRLELTSPADLSAVQDLLLVVRYTATL